MTTINTFTHQSSVKQEFRALMQQRRSRDKQRQRSMRVRLEAEIGN